MSAMFNQEAGMYKSLHHICSACNVPFECNEFSRKGCSCTPDDATCKECEQAQIGQPVVIDESDIAAAHILDVPPLNRLDTISSNMMEIVARIATDGDVFAQQLWHQLFPNETAADFQARVIRQGTYDRFRLYAHAKIQFIHVLRQLIQRIAVMTFDDLVKECIAAYEHVERTGLATEGPNYKIGHPYRAPGEKRRVDAMIERERRAVQERQRRQIVTAQEERNTERQRINQHIHRLQERLRILDETDNVANVLP